MIPKTASAMVNGPPKGECLPSACREEMLQGLPREELRAHPLLGPYLKDFFGQAGQPPEVREAYEQAIGQKVEGAKFFTVHGSGPAAQASADRKQLEHADE